jgi:hypothetical protein
VLYNNYNEKSYGEVYLMKTYVSPTLKFKEFRFYDSILASEGIITDEFGSDDAGMY